MKPSAIIRKMTRLSSPFTICHLDKRISTSFNKGCIQEERRECFPLIWRHSSEKILYKFTRHISPLTSAKGDYIDGQISYRQSIFVLFSLQESESGGRLDISATERPEIYLTCCKCRKAWLHPSVTLQAIDWAHTPARVSRISLSLSRALSHTHTQTNTGGDRGPVLEIQDIPVNTTQLWLHQLMALENLTFSTELSAFIDKTFSTATAGHFTSNILAFFPIDWI